jgi:hypothetical protein
VARITAETAMATCAQGWLCGWISVSGAISLALARMGRSGVGSKRLGSTGGVMMRARGMFSIEVVELS